MSTPFPEPPFELQRTDAEACGHTTLLDATIARHKKHPSRWQSLCKATVAAVHAGRTKMGVQALVEWYRWNIGLSRSAEERETDFKISNSDCAFLARALTDAGIAPEGFFAFREQPSKKRRPPSDPQTPATAKPDPDRPGGGTST